MKDNFQIGFWNYVDARLQGAEDVKLWKEMGINTVMTGGVDFDDEVGSKRIAELLEECERQDMDVIVFENQFDIRTYLKQPREEWLARALQALRFYERFPAAKYMFVWDEPLSDEQWDAMGEVCKFLRENSQRIKGFSSLNHYCGNSRKDLYARMDKYVETCKPDLILYNCYSQCFDRQEEQEQGLENYFINLRLFTEYCKDKQIKLATSLICVGHWLFRTPNQDDIRWQLYTALAHGLQGVYWFHPLESPGQIHLNQVNYREYPINYRKEKTATYLPLSYENNHLLTDLKGFGLDEGAKLEKVYHVFRSYGGFAYFEKGIDEYVYHIENPYNKPLILSRFVRKDGKRVIMVVNNSQRGCASVTLIFNKELGIADRFEYLAAGSAMFIELDK